MNIQELKQLLKDSEVKGLKIFGNEVYGIPSSTVLGFIDQLDEQSPICLEDIIKRINELDFETRGVWLSGIIDESVIGYGSVKYHEGYEQGRMDSMMEREKVKIPQMVADWIDVCKENLAIGLYTAMNPDFLEQWNKSDELICWIRKTSNQELFARAWLDGYEVEKEKRYEVSIKASGQYLARNKLKEIQFMYNGACSHFTRKELEEAEFGWVFDCPGIEVEEVQDA